ncbi:MAG: hypothetical protein ACREBO_09990 [Novosphingobium sp.]
MRFLSAAPALALAFASTAQAAEPPCLTAAEFTAVSTYAMPGAIEAVAERCAPQLGASAFLKTDSKRLAARYAATSQAAWPRAKAAFLKVGGSGNPEAVRLFGAMPDDTLQPMVDGVLASAIAQKLPTDRCTAIDRLVRLLSPLPPENTAELIALAAGLGAKSDKAKVGQFSLCRE